jgi:hypothetical protein
MLIGKRMNAVDIAIVMSKEEIMEILERTTLKGVRSVRTITRNWSDELSLHNSGCK